MHGIVGAEEVLVARQSVRGVGPKVLAAQGAGRLVAGFGRAASQFGSGKGGSQAFMYLRLLEELPAQGADVHLAFP